MVEGEVQFMCMVEVGGGKIICLECGKMGLEEMTKYL